MVRIVTCEYVYERDKVGLEMVLLEYCTKGV